MAIRDYKSDRGMNQITKLSFKGLIVLQKLYIDMTKEEFFKNKNEVKGLENLTFVSMINKELLKKYGKR